MIAAIFGSANFDTLTFTINGGVIYYGRFITALITFLIIAATLVVIVKSFEELQKRRKGSPDEIPEDEKTDEVVLLTEIRDLLSERRP